MSCSLGTPPFPWQKFPMTKENFLYACCRKRPVDASASEFDSAMRDVFQILMNVSRECLLKFMDESDFEFAEYICESMVFLGSSNLQSITSDDTILSLYLQQVISPT